MNEDFATFIILDYERPTEGLNLVLSIRKKAKIPHKILYFSNGGKQDHVEDFAKSGLVDIPVLKDKNQGCGFGTIEAFLACPSRYAFYVQVDQLLVREINEKQLEIWKEMLRTDKKVVLLAGDQCQGRYSERAHFVDVEWYNSIPNKPGGGPGPYEHLPWNEGFVQNFLIEQGNPVHIEPYPWFGDCGKYSMRQAPDGALWRFRCDTKELWMLKPAKERYVFPPLNDSEWNFVLTNRFWPAGKIPESQQSCSFACFQ